VVSQNNSLFSMIDVRLNFDTPHQFAGQPADIHRREQLLQALAATAVQLPRPRVRLDDGQVIRGRDVTLHSGSLTPQGAREAL
jgi:hypothetical protein